MADKQVGPGLYVKLGLDYQGIIGGVGGISLALNQTLEVFGKFESAGRRAFQIATDAGQFGKTVKDNARDLGLSVEQYQKWSHAATAAGSSAEEMLGSIRTLSVRLKEVGDPGSEVTKAFKAIGVSAVDAKGYLRPMNDILIDTFSALSKLPEGAIRNQASMELFGRGFSDIADMASLSREELLKLLAVPPPFDQQRIEQLDDFNTKLTLINEELQTMTVEIGEKLVPVIEDSLFPAFQALKPLISDLIIVFDYLGEAIDRAATGYAIIRDPGNWEKISAGLNARQAQREEGREIRDLMAWIDQHPELNGDAFGLSKNPLLNKQRYKPDTSKVDAAALKSAQDAAEKLKTASDQYADSLQRLNDLTKERETLTRDYLEDVRFAGGDVSRIRSLTMNYNRSIRNQGESIASAQMSALQAGASYITAGGSANGFSLTINGNVGLSKDYTLLDLNKHAEQLAARQKAQRIQAGIRTSS